ncbi:DNA-directed RNA polymerase subunit beta [Kurthia sibirica]|uniref:DNA-directed RNA polymerase subunit beta n=2 Tax=Kurthia sibirica TaxID=202750 RepID=A0A2U3AL28_9BACL|nr:DNA-directed RNA polymerase subunit beta [Kurthia sibirica]
MSKSSIKMVLLRLVAIILLVLVAMIVGSMIGYGVIGDGDAMDVLKPATWTHVFDMMDGTQDK